MGIEDDATIRNSIFLSAAHGWLENAERLLFGGCKAQMVFPSGSADSIETEFSAAVAEALGGIVQPEDVTIASIERDSLRGLHGAADHGGGAFTQRCHVVSFSISPGAGSPQGNFIRERILAPGFPAVVGRCIEAGIRASEQRDTLWDGVGSSVALLEESVQVWKSGANDRDCTGYSAMHWAALNNQIPVIKMLVRHGGDVNAVGGDGQSPLHWAALKNHLQAVDALFEEGAELDHQDQWGFTAAMRTCQNGHIPALLLLIRRGADCTKADHEGHSALHWAVHHGHHAAAGLLLAKGDVCAQASSIPGTGYVTICKTIEAIETIAPLATVQIDARDCQQSTALHLAAKRSGGEMCRKLLAAGADVVARDENGSTPRQIARKARRSRTVDYLWWVETLPPALRRLMVARHPRVDRAFARLPTAEFAAGVAMIAWAYAYYFVQLLPSTAGAVSKNFKAFKFRMPIWKMLIALGIGWAHAILLLATPPMLYSYYKAFAEDPGIVPGNPEGVLDGLLRGELKEQEVVFAAMAPKTPRAKYSRYYKCYVARFDHDCPWISNVVGARNHLYFFLFCYLVTCCMGTWEVICYKSMTAVTAAAVQARCASAAAAAATPANRTASSPPAPPPPPDPVPPKAAEARGPAGQPAGEGSGARRYGQKAQGKIVGGYGSQPWTRSRVCPSPGDYMEEGIRNQWGAGVAFLWYGVMTFFTLLMTVTQLSQIVQNVTTNEAMNWARYHEWKGEDGLYRNPYHRGYVRNLHEFLTGYRAYREFELDMPRGGGADKGREMTALLSNQGGGEAGLGDAYVIDVAPERGR